jgi:amidohydrolase
VEEMIGIHLRPSGEAKLGQATPALCHGASYVLEYKIKGSATHGARQHLGVNAVDAAALAVMAVNTVHVDPRVPHSAKVTNLQTDGQAFNIIPDTVHMKLDLRAQSNEVMNELKQKIHRAITTSVESMGANAELTYSQGLPASDYDNEMVECAKKAIIEVLGSSMDPIVTPGGEDFHNYKQILNVKSAYIGLGADLTPGLHKPDMHFDLKALALGEKILTKIIENKLG